MSVSTSATSADDVQQFWFDELSKAQWFKKDPSVDQTIARRFAHLHCQAVQCELSHWRITPQGRLAEIIVLDQFSRNLYRDSGQAYASDALALALAQEAVRQGADHVLGPVERSFLYMPYMHSESPVIHAQAVELFDQPGLEENLRFELRHKEIIDRFGRYPHRNELLGRESTAEELEFLKQPGTSF